MVRRRAHPRVLGATLIAAALLAAGYCTAGLLGGSAFVPAGRFDTRAAARQHSAGSAAAAAGLLAPALLPALAGAEDAPAAIQFVAPTGSPKDVLFALILVGFLFINF